MSGAVDDTPVLAIGGKAYSGWSSIRMSRGVDRCVADFDIEVSERWSGQDVPWQILPFSTCTLSFGHDLVLTGYVDEYMPRIGHTAHSVRVRGRSKTVDLIEDTPDIPSGQFQGYGLAQIARSICALFNIQVVVDPSAAAAASTAFADATIERCETAFTFLERLGRLSAVLLTDDEQGRLVLTRAGSARAAGALLQGGNIQAADGVLSSRGRHSHYIVKGQHALGAGVASWGGAGGVGSSAPPAGSVQTQMQAVALDTTVPRYRPRVVLAESQLTQAQMQLRANWMKQFAYGQGTKAQITLSGWRQPDGSLWRVNQIVPTTAPMLGVDQDLLVASVEFRLTEADGRISVLHVAPVEAFTPDPGQVRVHKKKGKGGAGNIWSGAGGT